MTTRRSRVLSDEQRALRRAFVVFACTMPLAINVTVGWSSIPPGWLPYLTGLLGGCLAVSVPFVALTWYVSRRSQASIITSSGDVIACQVVSGEHGGLDAVPQRWLSPLEQVVDYRVGTYGARQVRFVVQRGYNFGITAGGPGRPHPPHTWHHPARSYATCD
ncbi:hypothetical protein DMB66_37955 [Actinoplanes sp. ATCC 53533]|uniref:hypothetical protein n=1 Tax=Actinoplanes sp. ATCC 53533 TaxID=1288362 RepID=UPI000F7B5C33|nr:hypothetical protein [Actinoplanes sp. ATCC 53533]RSM53965.1 hypothetical protein DMB66_37955 [Actinoplanes sp. ATCC 53533]